MGYEIDFIPVGENTKGGDAISLRFGNLDGPRNEQTVVVIDGGFEDSGEKLAKNITDYYKTDFIDLVVSTHPDADHSSGLEVILDKFKVNNLWMHLPWNHTDDIANMFKDGRVTDNSVKDSLRKSLDNARSLEQLAKSKGIPIQEPFSGLQDKSNRIVVLGPSETFYGDLLPGFRGTPEPKESGGILQKLVESTKDIIQKIAEDWNIETLDDSGETSPENNSSVVLLVAADDGYLLFTGDAGIPALKEVIDRMDSANFDCSKIKFVQVPHHCSKRNVSPQILDYIVGPKLNSDTKIKTAYASVPKDGSPKHPAKKVTNAFRRRGAPVYVTIGQTIHHFKDAPNRDWASIDPLPFYKEVEE